jgi:hypothetical protein
MIATARVHEEDVGCRLRTLDGTLEEPALAERQVSGLVGHLDIARNHRPGRAHDGRGPRALTR